MERAVGGKAYANGGHHFGGAAGELRMATSKGGDE